MQVTNGQLRCEPGAQGETAAQRLLKAIGRTGSLEGTAFGQEQGSGQIPEHCGWVGLGERGP